MRRSLLFALLIVMTTLLVQPLAVSTYGVDTGAGVVHAQGGEDGGGDDGGIVERIKKTVTNITRIVIPSPTMFSAINNVLARAGSGQLSDSVNAYHALARRVTGAIEEQLFPTDELTTIAESSLPLAAALAVPLFLLRLAIYHWRRLVGGDDTPAAAVGDWIIAAGWAYASGHLVTFVLKIGVDLAGAAFGSVPGLVGEFLLNAAPNGGVGLSSLVGLGFLATIIKVVTVIGMVAAVVAVLWAFAVASALSFILATTGPVAGVVGVIPQMRWLRSMWLKALVLMALFPVGAGALFKAAALVGAVSVSGVVGTVIRLIWLWGAVGFLFALAGIAGRFSIGTGTAVGMGMVRAGKAVVDLGATAAVGTATMGAGSAAALGAGAGGSGAAGSMGSSVAGLLGGSSSRGSASQAAGGAASAAGGTGSADTSSGGEGGTPLPPGEGGREAASQSLSQASTQQRAAGAARALGLGRLSNLFRDQSQQAQIEARRHELAARREEYLSGQRGDSGGDSDSRDTSGGSGSGTPPPSSGGGGGGTGPQPRPQSRPHGDSGSTTGTGAGSDQPGSGGRTQQSAQRGRAGTYSPSSASPTGRGRDNESSRAGGGGRSDSGQSSSQRGAAPAGGPVPAPSQRASHASPGNVSPDTRAGGGQSGAPQSGAAGQPGVADSLTSFSLSRPVRQQFAAGYHDAGGSEAAAQPAVEQLRDDLATVSGDDSTFHRFAGAGDDARDLGRLAAAYEQQQDRLPEAPADRLRQAYQTAYGDDATAHERDVPSALRDTLGDVGETTYNVDEEDRSSYRP